MFTPGGTATIQEYKDYLSMELTEHSLPYWHSLVDEVNGGYLVEPGELRCRLWVQQLERDVYGNADFSVRLAGTKFLVETARLIYVFSVAHLNGIEADGYDNYEAATTGLEFLLEHFKDTEYGGFFWGTDEVGNVLDDRKYLYGEAFGLISLSTYFRAFGDVSAREAALELFRTVSEEMADRESDFGGWFEHCERDWTVITEGEGELGDNGVKTSNALLHWLESLTDLAETVDDEDVFVTLAKVLDEDIVQFYPDNPEDAISERDLDGNILITGEDDYGHLVEFAWVMVKAQRDLGRELDWAKFDRYFQHVVAALDPFSGGIIDDIGEIVWWRQCELLTAFSVDRFLRDEFEDEDWDVLKKLGDLIICNIIDSEDGIMYYALDSDLSVKDPTKSSKWKAGYHETRALTSFIKFF